MEGREVAEALIDPVCLAQALRGQGLAEMHLSNLDEASRLFRISLDLAEQGGHDDTRAKALGNMGQVYARQGDVHQAEQYYRLNLELAQRTGNLASAAAAYGNIGSLYLDDERFDAEKALPNIERAIEIYGKLGQEADQAVDIMNKAIVFDHLGRFDDARELYRQAVEVFRRSGLRSKEADVLFCLGYSLEMQGDRRGAVAQARQALVIYKQLGQETEAELAEARIVQWGTASHKS